MSVHETGMQRFLPESVSEKNSYREGFVSSRIASLSVSTEGVEVTMSTRCTPLAGHTHCTGITLHYRSPDELEAMAEVYRSMAAEMRRRQAKYPQRFAHD